MNKIFVILFVALLTLSQFACSSEESNSVNNITDTISDVIIQQDVLSDTKSDIDEQGDSVYNDIELEDVFFDVVMDISPDVEEDIESADIGEDGSIDEDGGYKDVFSDIEDGGDTDVDGGTGPEMISVGNENNEEATSLCFNGEEVFLAGHSYNSDYSSSDFFIARVGDKTLHATHNNSEFDMAFGIECTEGGLFISGYTGSSGSFNGFTSLFNESDLSFIDSLEYKNQTYNLQFFASKMLKSGNIALAGFTSSSDNDAAVYIVTNAHQLLKKYIISEDNDQEFYAVDEGTNGNIIAAGVNVVNTTTWADMFVALFDSNLTPLWEKNFGSKEMESAYAVRALSNGNYVVGGYTEKDKNTRGRDGYLIYLDSDGKPLWEKTFGSEKDDEIKAITETEDGNIAFVIMENIYDPFSSIGDAIIVKIDKSGNIVNTEYLCPDCTVNAIYRVPDMSYYLIAGTYYNPPGWQGESDAMLIEIKDF